MKITGTVTAHFTGVSVLRTYQASNLRKWMLLGYLYGMGEDRMVKGIRTQHREWMRFREKLPLIGGYLLRKRLRPLMENIRGGIDK